MSYKIRLPDENIEPVWDKMTKKEKEWYEEFKKATEYYNWKSLKYLCEIAPSDQFDRLYVELHYESMAYDRARYEIPKKHKSTYTEWDYSWAAPKKASNKRQLIDNRYEAENTDPEFYSAPGKDVK